MKYKEGCSAVDKGVRGVREEEGAHGDNLREEEVCLIYKFVRVRGKGGVEAVGGFGEVVVEVVEGVDKLRSGGGGRNRWKSHQTTKSADTLRSPSHLLQQTSRQSYLLRSCFGSPPQPTIKIGPLRCWPGGLCLSRSIGDMDVGEFIVPVPYVKQVKLSNAGGRLIISSDGVWDALSSEVASV
ncbi:putative protein phosphatase 2C 15 [Acorus calamus]|uniref:protein-serine/threonine phosphatase n=1 Tax=Acorus calamus TaxID=4465 RepID=A0AAV9DW41_ACOCL|nr:putative protein phosphatase 2C 15 [Acorus calamus]